MSQHINYKSHFEGFGDTKINSRYFREELLKLGYEEIDFEDGEEHSPPEDPIEVIEERLWDRTNELFEKFIQELFDDTIDSFDELASLGFFRYFYEFYITFDKTCLDLIESIYYTPIKIL